MRWEQPVEYAILSDIGFRRQNNQDCATVLMASNEETWSERGHLFVVADGMGGHAVGELASKIAVDTVPLTFHKLRSLPAQDALRKSIEDANIAIYTRGQQNREFRNMGTTCTTLVLSPEGAFAGHVGDSRLYRIRDQRIDQLTFDHSLQWELIRQGKMKTEDILLHQPRNVITRCLGPEPRVEIDLEGPFPVISQDVYLLCSDGLTGLVTDCEIGMIAQQLPPADACRLLVNLANLRGGTDNISVIIVRVGDVPAGLGERPPPEPVERSGLGWRWLLGFWGLAILIVFGVSLLLLGSPVEGVLTLGVGLFGAAGLCLAWWKTPAAEKTNTDLDATTLWKPHRSASAKLDRKFLGELGQLEYTLQQTAAEESWKIDWTEHKLAYEKAKKAVDAEDYSAALREFGKAIQTLMSGIQHQRKRMERVAKWGLKPAAAKAKERP